jgi:hypothetical protein
MSQSRGPSAVLGTLMSSGHNADDALHKKRDAIRLPSWRKQSGQAMNKFLSLVVAIVTSGVASANAMPVAALASPQTELTIPVGSGCGLGVRRGPGSDPVYAYDGNGNGAFHHAYWQGFYSGYRPDQYRGYRNANCPYVRYPNAAGVVIVDKGVCGFGSYLVCAYGTCWRRCY